MMSVWDYCNIDPSLVEEFEVLQEELFVFHPATAAETSSASSAAVATSNTAPSSSSSATGKTSNNYATASGGVDNQVQSILFDTNESCRQSLESLDSVLLLIQDVKSAFFDVTGRTNTLIQKCETLLDQQHTLQNTVEVLHKTLKPFDEIEEVAHLLGIPFDMPANTVASKASSSAAMQQQELAANNLDPRSPEFQEILVKLSNAVVFLRNHHDIMEHDRYTQWLDKLQIRATSLIGRAMRDLLEKASKQCREMIQQKIYHHSNTASAGAGTSTTVTTTSTGNAAAGNKVLLFEDQPLESSFIYQKFRSLAYRMKELANVLMRGGFNPVNSEGGATPVDGRGLVRASSNASMSKYGNHHSGNNLANHDMVVLQEVKKQYSMIRIELLVPFLREAWTVATANTAANSGHSAASLSSILRQAFSILLRVTQLEVQLFESLFGSNSSVAGETPSGGATPVNSSALTPSNSSSSSSSKANHSQHSDMLRIIESIANTTRDFLRPHIIRESNVDELCRVISALSEDMRAQIAILSIASLLSKQLISGLDGTVNDAKERLTYCAETKLRQDIQMFEPLPSQLAYPDILEQYEEARKKRVAEKSATQSQMTAADVYNTWYPPMRQCLSLLSKLYGVVDGVIFEDFARRCIESSIQALLHASDAVKRTRQSIHGDLFLIRHLLILREQLIPFEMKLSSVERHLDFSTTTQAWTKMLLSSSRSLASNAAAATGTVSSPSGATATAASDPATTAKALANLLRFDTNNFLLQFATQGAPLMQELTIDAKRDLDVSLKKACVALKSTALKLMVGPIDGLLAKVQAFIGDIPYQQGMHSVSQDEHDDDHRAAAKSKLLASHAHHHAVLLSNETKQTLKNQSFLRAERMKECLEQVQQLLIQRIPDIKEMMTLYIDNVAARNVLIKSIVQEFDISKKKLECVMYSCVDAGQALRDLEHLVHHVSYTIASELAPSPTTAY